MRNFDKLWYDEDEAEGREIIGALAEALHALRDLTEAAEGLFDSESDIFLEDLTGRAATARAILDRFDWPTTEESGD